MHRLVQSACRWPAVVSGDLQGWQAVSQADTHDNDLGDVISLADIEPGRVNAGWNRSRIYSHHKLAVFHGGLGLGSCCNFL